MRLSVPASPMNIVTGSTGFVGRALVEALARRGRPVTAPDRDDLQSLARGAPPERLSQSLRGAVVYHLAAIAHRGAGASPEAEYDAVNRALPIAVARVAQQCGARRFVFLSTTKVLGDVAEQPLDESAPVAAPDAYSRAKAQAEEALLSMSGSAGFDVVVLRPPLVYGPRVRANFLRLMRLSASGWPLPLGRVFGLRSFLYLENLTDALLHVGSHPMAGGEIFHVTDGLDLSVLQVVRTLAAAMRAPCRIVPVPVGWLRAAARMAGRLDDVDRLVLPCRIDSHKLSHRLGWEAPFTAQAGLQATAGWFLESVDPAAGVAAAAR